MALMQHRVVHIHPTLLCNLTCAHCYSSSSPAEAAGLDPDAILHTTAQLRPFDVQTASISGGEPTVYKGLDPLCAGLTAQGYSLSIITNGMLTQRAVDLSKTHNPDIIAVSFDGLAPRHDLIRRRKGSFEQAMKTLRALAQSGQRTAVVLSFGEDGIEDLPDLLDLVVSAGAQKVQFHPVSKVGRGLTQAIVKAPSEATLLRVLVLSQMFQALYPDVSIDCDALTGAELQSRCAPQVGTPVSPVVISSDGSVGPIAYGLAGKFGFGRVGATISPPVFSADLAALAERVMQSEGRKAASNYYDAFEEAAREAAVVV